MRAEIDDEVAMDRAEDGTWAALSGVVDHCRLIDQMVRVEALSAVAEMRDMAGRIDSFAGEEGD